MTLEQKAARLEDPGAELLDRVQNLLARYGRAALIALAALVVVAAASFFMLRARAASESQAAGKLAEANVYFWQGAYDRSLSTARQVTQQWPGTPSGTDARRVAGDDLFWMGRFKEASAEYQAYLDRQKTGILADAVRRSLAYSLESDRRYKEAAAIYEGLVGRFDRESSAEFLYAAARCERLLNQPKEAEQLLTRILDEYGETTYGNRARMERAELAGSGR